MATARAMSGKRSAISSGAGALARLRVGCALPVSLAGVLIGAACGSSSRPLGEPPLDLTNGGVDAGWQGGGGNDAGTGPAGPGGAPPDGGEGLADAGDEPACGNGVLDDGEACDPGLSGAASCLLRGFDDGLLRCDAACQWDASACSGAESCNDARDNDGDGSVDCEDVADCATLCADACASPEVLAPNSSAIGSTLGHAAALAASCSEAAPSGPEVVYRVDVAEEGKLDVYLSSDHDATLSLRTSCASEASEVACGGQTRLTLDVLAGETYFVVVDGRGAAEAGEFLLELTSRQQACGDGIRDVGEACDDGNINDGDGCDPDCYVESSESNPNGSLGSADDFDFSPWFAELNPAGDVDFFRVSLSATSSTLVVNTVNLADGACGFNLMDTVVEIFDTDARGNALLASDDDGGDGKCSRAIASGLSAGTYYVSVRAGDNAQPATFPYRLDVSIGECGDGSLTLGEECDDENLTPGDGCDAECQSEEIQ